MTRIEWNETPSGHSDRGTVNGIGIFSVGYDGINRDRENPYYVRCDLPGYTTKHLKAPSMDAAKGAAEAMLARWVERIGAAFPEVPES